MSDPRKYSDSEVREIIDRALQAQGDGSPSVDHSDLVAIGEQIGISPQAMTRAAQEVATAKLDTAALGAIKSRRRKWLAAHAASFAVINGLLFTVNFLTTPGEWWALFPIVFWGLALALHAVAAFALGISERALSRERGKLEAGKARSIAKWRVEAEQAAKPPRVEGARKDADEAAEAAASSSVRAQR
jgi:hypothetical protein